MSKRNFDHTATESMAHVRRFDSLGREHLTLAGGKGVNLGELVGAGFPIPSGFVVTTDVYRALTDDPEIRDAIDRLEGLDPADADELTTAAKEVRSLVREREFDEAIGESITDALDTGADSDASYAVRSSATAEDFPTASFAGQHETFLGVSGAPCGLALTSGGRCPLPSCG